MRAELFARAVDDIRALRARGNTLGHIVLRVLEGFFIDAQSLALIVRQLFVDISVKVIENC